MTAVYYTEVAPDTDGVISGVDNTLKAVKIADGASKIAFAAFKNYTNLAAVKIPDSVTTYLAEGFYGSSTFYGCSNLRYVELSHGAPTIERYMFRDCKALSSIVIPDSVTSINTGAFESTGLTSVVVPESITVLDDSVFHYCNKLTSVTLPSGLREIRANSLQWCTSLVSIEIPSTVEKIGLYAFGTDRALERIYLSSSISAVRDGAFDDCNSLTIYAAANEKPSGWESDWNPDNRPVYWGYQA